MRKGQDEDRILEFETFHTTAIRCSVFERKYSKIIHINMSTGVSKQLEQSECTQIKHGAMKQWTVDAINADV